MFGSTILDIALGLVFIYLLFSLITSMINEWIASMLNKRGKNLFDGIVNLLNDPQFTGLAQLIYTHGLIEGTQQYASVPSKKNRLPSYMDSKTFAKVLTNILRAQGTADDVLAGTNPASMTTDPETTSKIAVKTRGPMYDQWGRLEANLLNAANATHVFEKGIEKARVLEQNMDTTLANLERSIKVLPAGHTREALMLLVDQTRRDVRLVEKRADEAALTLQMFQKNVETWFNASMDRVSGWYKRWTQGVQIVIAILLVTGLNVDTLMLYNRLSSDKELRSSIAQAAQNTIQEATDGTLNSNGNTTSMRSDANQATSGTDQQVGQEGNKSSDQRTTTGATSPNLNELRKTVQSEFDALKMPLGWANDSTNWHDLGHVVAKIAGLLLSVCAISLGAPFWFDLLSRIVKLRGSGAPAGASKEVEDKHG